VRVLLVSSFVLPHAGGVEQFVASIQRLLEARGAEVRVLACRREGEDSSADAVVPTWFAGPSGWPVPVGGWRTLWREAGAADAVIANGSLQLLPLYAVLAARGRRVPALLVIHGSGAPLPHGSSVFRALRSGFQRSLARVVVRSAVAVSVSHAGVEGARERYGVAAHHLPYPLPELPDAPGVSAETPLRVAWIGRLSPEKDPATAVAAIDRLRERRDAVLEMYGDGRLRGEIAALAASRPWVTVHGSRPWPEVLAAQASAHAVLATSVWDNAQVALLESLSRGVPAATTRVGDAPRYLLEPGLDRFCVPAGDADALAGALDELAASYDDWRARFAANGERLRERHGRAAEVLEELIAAARDGRAAPGAAA
jgi:glycosyltransferase involved in cell wall biosynthesis